MSDKTSQICDCFSNGYYCSQAILSAYCEEYGLNKETAMKLSCGLAAGMARLSSTCGAVTGAYLVISLIHGNSKPGDSNAIEKTFALIQEFDKRFSERHGSTNCKELLGVDLLHGDKAIAKEQVQTICPELVKDAAEILESVLQQSERMVRMNHALP